MEYPIYRVKQNGVTVRELLDAIPGKADKADTYTKEQTDGLLDEKADKTELSSEVENLQDQIDAIVADKAVVALNASPSVVFVDTQNVITLTATSNTNATHIVIKKGNTVIAEGAGTSLSGTSTITPSANTQYIAEFTIAGITKTASRTVSAVHPIYYGAGSQYTDADIEASVRTTPAGTYTINVATGGSYVFLNVPATMTISKATMSGFEFPLEEPQPVTIGGVNYKSYKSANTYDAGTLTIVIS